MEILKVKKSFRRRISTAELLYSVIPSELKHQLQNKSEIGVRDIYNVRV